MRHAAPQKLPLNLVNQFLFRSLPRTVTVNTNSEAACARIMYLEHVVVHVNLSYTYRGHIGLRVTSPGDTTSTLLRGQRTDAYTNTMDWSVLSVHFWGENPQHEWKLDFFRAFENFESSGVCRIYIIQSNPL